MLLRSLPLTYDSFVLPKLAFLGLSSAVALAFWALSGAENLRWHRAGYALVAFLGLAALSTVFALDPAVAFFGKDAANGLVAYLCYGVVVFLIMQLARGTSRIVVLTRCIVASAAFASLVSIYQAILIRPEYLESIGLGVAGYLYGRGGGLFGNPDYLGAFLVVPLILALTLAITEKTLRAKAIAGVAAGLIGTAAIVAQVRGGWLGIIAGAVVLVFFLARGGIVTGRRLLIGGAGAAAVAVFGLAIANPTLLMNRVTFGMSKGLDALSGGRLSGWREALWVIADRPLLGTGPDSFTLGWYKQAAALADRFTGAPSYFEDPHNFPLAIAATMGIPAVIALLALVVLAFRAGLSNIRLTTDAAHKRGLYAGWLAGFVGLCVASVFGVTTIPLALMFFVCVGVLLTPTAVAHEVPATRARVVGVGAGVIAVACLVSALVPFVADYHLGQFKRTGLESSLRTARALSPWSQTIQSEYLGYRRAQLLPILQAGGTEAAAALDAFDADVFQLSNRHPHELQYTLSRTDLLTQAAGLLGTDYAEKAFTVISLATLEYPKLTDLKITRARALNNLERFDEAIAALEPLPESVLRDTALAESYILAKDEASARKIILQIKRDYVGSAVAEAFLSQSTIKPYVTE